MAKDIFFSYGHDEHKEFVLKVRDYLEKEGFDVFVDSDKLRLADDWEFVLEKAIAEYDKVVFFITPYSARRPRGYCRNEISYAHTHGKKIYPIMVDYYEMPLSIARTQYLDMQSYIQKKSDEQFFEEKMKELVKALKSNSDLEDGDQQAKLRRWLNPIDFSDDYRQCSKVVGREWIIDEINRWILEYPDSKLLWLKGSLGYGKSTISTLLSNRHKDVIGVHFCDDYLGSKSKADRIIKTLAFDFQTQISGYYDEIKDIDIDDENIFELFEHLILNPLHRLQKIDKNYIFVIDAIENTLDVDRRFVKLISERAERLPKNVRIVITSSDEPELRELFSGIKSIDLDKHRENQHDCIRAIETELKQRKKYKKYMNDEVFRNALLKKSDLNMLYIDRFFHVAEEKTIDLSNPRVFPSGLKSIYRTHFDKLVETKQEYKEKYRPILEILVAYIEPIPKEMLSKILEEDLFDILDILEELGSIIRIEDGKIRLYNKPLKNWLINDEHRYRISIERGKQKIETFLSKILQKDNYDCEYIHFYNLNKKLISLISERTGDIQQYMKLISHCQNDESKINLLLDLAKEFSMNNEVNISISLGERAVLILEELYDEDQEQWEESYIKAYNRLAVPLSKRGKYKQAIIYFERIKNKIEKVHGSISATSSNMYIHLMISLAHAYRDDNRHKDAVILLLKILSILEELDTDENREQWGVSHAIVLNALAHFRDSCKENIIKSSPIELVEEASLIWKDLYHRNPIKWSGGYAGILRSVAYQYRNSNRTQEALDNEEKAYRIFKDLFDDNPKRWVGKYRQSLVGLNYDYRVANRIRESIDKGKEALEVVEELYSKDDRRWAVEYSSTLRNLAESYEINNNIKMSKRYKEKALRMIEEKYQKYKSGKFADEYLKILFSYMDLVKLMNDTHTHCKVLKKTAKVINPLFAKNRKRYKERYLKYLDSKASYYKRSYETIDKAIKIELIIVQICEEHYANHSNEWAELYVKALGHLANSYALKEEADKAHMQELKSKKILFSLYKKDNVRWGDLYTKSQINLAAYEYMMGKIVSAIRKAEYSLRILEDLYNGNKARWADSYIKGFINLIIYYGNSGRHVDAATIGYEAKEIIEDLYEKNPDRWIENYSKLLNNLSVVLRKYNIDESIALSEKSVGTIGIHYKNHPERWENDYKQSKIILEHTYQMRSKEER